MPGYKQNKPVFSTHALDDRSPPSPYPVLWGHNNRIQTRLLISPDRYAEILPGKRDEALEVWQKTASKLHSNLNFRVNSQKFAMCLTPEKSLGGRGWPNIIPHHDKYELPLLLWSNSTLGIITFWYNGTRGQQGRTNVTIGELLKLPVLDCGKLRKEQFESCAQLYDDLKDLDFLPANEAYRDPARILLDEHLYCEILGMRDVTSRRGKSRFLEGLNKLRMEWCKEPTVHAGQTTRPGGDNSILD